MKANHKLSKIVFLQPGYAHYRYELFELLHNNYDVTFVFLSSKSTYPSQSKPNPSWSSVTLNIEEKKYYLSIDLFKLLFRLKPEVIITSIIGSLQTNIAIIAGKIMNIPVILWSLEWKGLEDSYLRNRPIWKRIVRELLRNWNVRNVKAVVAGGKNSVVFHEYLGYPENRTFSAINSTIDIKHLEISNEKLARNKHAINVLYLSRIIRCKGLDVLIRAFSELNYLDKNVQLMIIGEGPFRPYCENLAKNLQVNNVKFYGKIQNEKVHKFYSCADIFVLPNSGIDQFEAWGLVINEAASMSLPIITTTAVGAAGEIVINNLNGYIVEHGNVTQLKFALETLIDDENKRKEMGKASRELFNKLNNYNKMYKSFADAISCVLEE
jgi:glycosyltransferase involved in cell wall biosynthesis